MVVVALRALALLVVLAAGTAHAAPSRGESPEYQRAIRSALAEFDAGNFPEARALFTTAHDLYPNARTFRGLGFVEFELRNYVDSIDYLQAALSSDKKPLEGELRRSTDELLARAREMIAKVTLNIVPRAESLVLDGVPVVLSDEGTLTLPVGDHVLEARTTGYLPERRPLKIARGGALSLTIELKRVEAEAANGPRVSQAESSAAPADASRATDTSPARRAWYKSHWLWTSVAVIAVGAGVGTYFLLRPDNNPGSAPPPTTANTPPGGVIQALRSF